MNHWKAEFNKSSITPLNNLSEICFLGKSNVGKSSLINAICNNKSLAYTSKKPGKTKVLNYFTINDNFSLVDVPGYGYHKNSASLDKQFADVMKNYFKDNFKLKNIFLLVDSRRLIAEHDQEMIDYVKHAKLEDKLVYIFTKFDQLNQSQIHTLKTFVQKQNIKNHFFCSIEDKNSVERIKTYIESAI